MCYVHSLVLYRVTLRQFSAFACCRIFGAGVSSFVSSVGLIDLVFCVLFAVLHELFFHALCSVCVHLLVLLTVLLILLFISCAFILHCIYGIIKRLRACFALFFWPHVCFLAFSLCLRMNLVQRTPCVPSLDQNDPLRSSWLSLSTWRILILVHTSKKCPSRLFTSLFDLFLTLTIIIYPAVPFCTHLHTSANNCDHFCQLSQNTMSGEIFPVIGSKLGLAWSFLLFLQCLCVLSCTLYPKAPMQTHSNPIARIFTRVTLSSRAYMCNLIKI